MFRRFNGRIQQSHLFRQTTASFHTFSTSTVGSSILKHKHKILGVGVALSMIVSHRQHRYHALAEKENKNKEASSEGRISSSDKENFFRFMRFGMVRGRFCLFCVYFDLILNM
jgi:hypothetical protein